MSPPISSPADDPLSPDFFLQGREVVRTPWPYDKSPEQVTGDIVRKLGALGTVSPIMLRISVAKIVADAITDKEDQTLIDLMRAVDIIYQITKIRVFEMSEDLKMNPGESELAFALRIAVNQIATGQSKIVTPADMEPFDHSMNEMMEQARRLLYQGPYILTCA